MRQHSEQPAGLHRNADGSRGINETLSTIEEAVEIGRAVPAVWIVLSDFQNLAAWLPNCIMLGQGGKGPGALRRFAIGKAYFSERLDACDEQARVLAYSMLSGPLPVTNYSATAAVHPVNPNSSRVVWKASYRPAHITDEKCERLLRRALRGSLESLRVHVQNLP